MFKNLYLIQILLSNSNFFGLIVIIFYTLVLFSFTMQFKIPDDKKYSVTIFFRKKNIV